MTTDESMMSPKETVMPARLYICRRISNSQYAMIADRIFAASVISSSNLAYDNTKSVSTKTNVQEAVDDLYDKATVGDATEENILSDKTALVSGNKVTE